MFEADKGQKFDRMVVDLPAQGQTTKSYWLQDGANPLAREGADAAFVHEEVDIVVIGAGITGVSVVHHLMHGIKAQSLQSLKIVVLEARDFCML
jgi:NADH dehydrogenase FAD-containing subunit